jgi:hypothetical protein
MIGIIVIASALMIAGIVINNQYYEITAFLDDYKDKLFGATLFKTGDLLEEIRPDYLEKWEEYELARIEIIEVGRRKYRLMVTKHSDLTSHSMTFNSSNFFQRNSTTPPPTNVEETVKFDKVHPNFIKIGRSVAGHGLDAEKLFKSIK